MKNRSLILRQTVIPGFFNAYRSQGSRDDDGKDRHCQDDIAAGDT